MKKILFLFLYIFPFLFFGQNQLGNDIDGESAFDQSGISVSLSTDGSIVAIGAYGNDGNGSASGHVRVYSWSGSTWTQLGNDIDGEASGDFSGWSVSLSSDGSIVAIGAYKNDGNDGTGSNSGHVRVYSWSGSAWTQLGSDIDGEASGDFSGWSVSLSSDGSRIAIGAVSNDGNGTDSGHVRVFSWSGSTWSQLGNDIDGEASGDSSGQSVSLSSDGSRIAIGAYKNDGNGSNSGHVRVYSWSGSAWMQLGSDIDGEASGDNSGISVSLSSDGSRIAIGAPTNFGNGGTSGHVRVYSWSGSTWAQLGNDIDGEATIPASDASGQSVYLSANGSIVAIGAPLNNSVSQSGHVRVYSFSGGVWTQLGNDIDGEASGDWSGYSVSLSSDGSIVAIGANANDGNGTDSGHVRVYSLSAVLSSDSFVLSQFSLYPNPSKNQFTIQLKQDLVLQKVAIYNNLGQLLHSTTNNIVTTNNLVKGIYYIVIETDKGKATKKLIVE